MTTFLSHLHARRLDAALLCLAEAFYSKDLRRFNTQLQLHVAQHGQPRGDAVYERGVAQVSRVDHYWGSTTQTGGVITIVVARALMFRGPFSLIVRVLGHELQHARQIAADMTNVDLREFLAYSWMLKTKATLPPLAPDDVEWIAVEALKHYDRVPHKHRVTHKARHDGIVQMLSASDGVGVHQADDSGDISMGRL